jgi:hypothetical protein
MNILQNQSSSKVSSDSPWDESEKNRTRFRNFWSVLSIALNVILVITVIILAIYLFTWKKVAEEIAGGLYYNFILMDQATIVSTVEVDTDMPVQFDLPLKRETTVRLTKATEIDGARVTLRTGGLNIVNAPADIILSEGTILPVELDMVVPVDTTIPVQISVPVTIPLNETELHAPFVGLQEVVSPIYWWLDDLPDSWWEIFTGK